MLLNNFYSALLILPTLLVPLAFGQNATERAFNKRRTLSIGIVSLAVLCTIDGLCSLTCLVAGHL